MTEAMIERARAAHREGWARLRSALWRHHTLETHRAEIAAFLTSENDTAFVALSDTGEVVGFAEASLRRDYVNGCSTSPTVFLEGVYVDPDYRQKGLAKGLCAAVQAWGLSLGCREMASDADLANLDSHVFHRAVGFAETERVVFFRKPL